MRACGQCRLGKADQKQHKKVLCSFGKKLAGICAPAASVDLVKQLQKIKHHICFAVWEQSWPGFVRLRPESTWLKSASMKQNIVL